VGSWYDGLKATRAAVQTRRNVVRPLATIGLIGPEAQRVIFLPPRGIRSGAGGGPAFASTAPAFAPLTSGTYLMSLAGVGSHATRPAGVKEPKFKVVDSVSEDGAKLVEIRPAELQALRIAQPGLRIVPEVFYEPAVHLLFVEAKAIAAAKASTKKITFVVASTTGHAVAGVPVVAFTNFAQREGAEAVTNSKGVATVTIPSTVKHFERVYVYPETGFWGCLRRNVAATGTVTLRLNPIDLTYTDCVRHVYGRGGETDGAGVKVAVVDSGVALDHPDLRVAGGACTIGGEPASAYGPVGGPHGTHVAGIIGARGTPPAGIRGVAPAAALYSFRVFPAGGSASNFSIIKAIDQAVQAGCDLINMSLGGGPRDTAIESAIGDARLAGTVCIVAAGNDYRGPVSNPAAYQLCTAVSAMGRKGTFPLGTTESGDVAAPYGTDRKNFLAAFSNVGPEIDVTGPGLGVISTVPGGYGVMSGTSMACPAVTGITARMLATAANRATLEGSRDENRSNSIIQLLLSSCRQLGFKPAPNFEGAGLPAP
jgi:subtilisin